MAQRMQQLSDDLLRVEEGSLDPALQRLELNGWVEDEWGLPEALSIQRSAFSGQPTRRS
jgi:PadR family transcriptional regulator PadR